MADASGTVVNGSSAISCRKSTSATRATSVSSASAVTLIADGIGGGGNNFERLLKRLANLESIVYELLTLKKATPVLKEKLVQIDDLILDLPDDGTELVAEWRNKVAIWWKKYAAYSEEHSGGGGSHGRGHRGPQPPIGFERRGGGGSASLFGGRRRSPNNSSGGGRVDDDKIGPNPYQFPSKEQYHEEREKIRIELAQDFAGLRPLESGTLDIDALKRLHGVVRKARTKTHSFDASLKEEIFCFAYRKLSPEKREKFLEQYGSNRMLVNLANFLRAQVDAYFQDLDIVKSADGGGGGDGQLNNMFSNGSMRSGFEGPDGSICYVQNFDGRQQGFQRGGGRNGGGFDRGACLEMDGDERGSRGGGGGPYREPRPEVGPNQCRYCRKEGHRIVECTERPVCYNCNQPGHRSKYCKKNEKVGSLGNMMDCLSISN